MKLQSCIGNVPYNSKYTSHQTQKEILHILSSKVKNHIHEEIGDSKVFIIVNETHDESKKEQMALLMRFVDKNDFIQELFFDIVQVRDTTTLNLKKKYVLFFLDTILMFLTSMVKGMTVLTI